MNFVARCCTQIGIIEYLSNELCATYTRTGSTPFDLFGSIYRLNPFYNDSEHQIFY